MDSKNKAVLIDLNGTLFPAIDEHEPSCLSIYKPLNKEFLEELLSLQTYYILEFVYPVSDKCLKSLHKILEAAGLHRANIYCKAYKTYKALKSAALKNSKIKYEIPFCIEKVDTTWGTECNQTCLPAF